MVMLFLANHLAGEQIMNRRDTTHAERIEMVERHLAGETLQEIADSLQLNRYTVRKWWRIYRQKGWVGIEPKAMGPPQVGALGHYDPMVKYVALRLKRKHPRWGMSVLRLHMQRRPSLQGLRIPGETALWNYVHQFGSRLTMPRRLQTTRPALKPIRANEPHACWEIDFKGDERVSGCGIVVAPFAVTDETSGVSLARIIHVLVAKGNREGLTMRLVQKDLRQIFTKWGLPDAIRMDRDSILVGSTRLEWPSILILWLLGLGIQPVINRAYRPTDNAQVERSHRTWKGDVLIGEGYDDAEAIQIASDQCLEDRCFHLPSRRRGCNGLPPALAFPNLTQPRRPYHSELERGIFDLEPVDAYLAQWQWQRIVDSSAKISLGGCTYRVGKPYQRKIVKLKFDPATRDVVCFTIDGVEIKRFQVADFSPDYILGGMT